MSRRCRSWAPDRRGSAARGRWALGSGILCQIRAAAARRDRGWHGSDEFLEGGECRFRVVAVAVAAW